MLPHEAPRPRHVDLRPQTPLSLRLPKEITCEPCREKNSIIQRRGVGGGPFASHVATPEISTDGGVEISRHSNTARTLPSLPTP